MPGKGKKMIAIIDYDAGNIRSVEKALARLGQQAQVTREPSEILEADGVILPGVGAFGDAMEKISGYGLVPVIRECVESQTPFLGICLGLQLLFESSQESPGAEGLGILKGKICRSPDAGRLKVPHIGWNDLRICRRGRLLEGIPENAYVYFVHSYYLQAGDRESVLAQTEYGVLMDTCVEQGNVFACQFHPEKSSDTGLQILQNFIRITEEH